MSGRSVEKINGKEWLKYEFLNEIWPYFLKKEEMAIFNFFFDWPHSLTSPGICLPFPPEHSECTSSNLVVLRIWVFLGMPQVITARMEGNSGVQNPRGSCTLNSAMTAPLFCLHIVLCKISFGKRKKINSLKFEKYNSSSLKIHSKEQYFM